jgi:hypothetical protein
VVVVDGLSRCSRGFVGKKKCVWWREGRRVVIRFEYFIYGPEEKDHGARKVRRKLS